jgi:hypothetical protein
MRDRVTSADLPEPEEKWQAVVAFLAGRAAPDELLLAPFDLIHLFRGTVALHVPKRMLGGARLAAYVFETAKLAQIDPEHLIDAAALTPVYADPGFAVFARAGQSLRPEQEVHLAPVLARMRAAAIVPAEGVGAVVATHNRAWALGRTLRSLAPAFRHLAVVDDGSRPWQAWRNRRAARAAGAAYIRIPGNPGLANAVNVGVSHWLAHAGIGWISVFNDDVRLAPGAVEALMAVSRAAPYPRDAVLFTGYRSPFHRVHGAAVIAGREVLLGRSSSGQHLHAHRDHWQRLLPIPTAYIGAPKTTGGLFPGHGSDMDWWIGSWSPESAVKRGGDVVVIPGLVETFGRGRSTWGAPGV